ncbi:MAG TPA: universal stress protein [Bacteroidia bacterium]|nr:universal stress protein [Bacteroidia bacterium]
MKSILVATDFSDAAKNATDYAAQLSKITGSTLVIFNTWALPPLTEGAVVVPTIMTDIEKAKDDAMLEETERIEKMWDVRASASHTMGFATEEIAYAAKLHGAAIVVVGMRQHNKIGKILGSVSTQLVHLNKFPVLVIPEKTGFHQPKTLLFATNLHTEQDWHEVDALKELAKKLHSGLHILNVREKEKVHTADESHAGIRLESRLKDISHSWHFPEDGDIVHAISKVSDEIGADWLVLIPHHLPWIQQLFHQSVTNKVAFVATKPLLALPERKVRVDIK